MSKKINFGTINAESLNTISKFHVAIMELKKLTDTYKTKSIKLQKKMDSLLESRQTDLNAGLDRDDVIRKYDIAPVQAEISALKNKFVADKAPHNDAKKKCLELIPDSIYEAYKIAMSKGQLAPLTVDITTFLSSIGVETPETATSKFAQIMSVRVAGMRKASSKQMDGGDYVVCKKSVQFKELFMMAFLQYVITEKGVVVVNEDNTLSMKQF